MLNLTAADGDGDGRCRLDGGPLVTEVAATDLREAHWWQRRPRLVGGRSASDRGNHDGLERGPLAMEVVVAD